MKSLTLLKKYFGFESFRPLQEEIINAVIDKKDCLVLMPTGGGKSLCYQIPALLSDGITVVISPLIALMKDQVDALRLNGVSAAFLNSSLDKSSQDLLLDEMKENKIKLIYIAPERLSSGLTTFISFLKTLNVSLFAIDEAHCISHWGHDFRPDYLLLSKLKENFPDVPIIALTATADMLTRKDISEKLHLKNPQLFISSFNRSNIRYIIEEKVDHVTKILEFVNSHKDESGIIYCLSRNNTEELSEKLQENGFNAAAYHAGLNPDIRNKRQEQFKRDEIKIIVATIAFGMGIDKSNVRYVIHSSVPKNIEGYYQETGRAGRDGLPAQALLFYSSSDFLKLKSFVTVEGNQEQTKIMLKKLNQMADFCSSYSCRREFLLNYFDEKFSAPCGNCDICLGSISIPSFDGTIIAQKALSAIVRLKERFGITYTINFLKGSDSKKMYDEHRFLPTFGKGSEFSVDEWRNYFRQLIDQRIVEQHGEFSILCITEKGRDVLYKDLKVMLKEFKDKKIVKKERKDRYAVNTDSDNYNYELFEELRQLRLRIAQADNLPSYIIFPDSTLVELATFFPMNKTDLQHISGFGQIKIGKYGDEFLSVIISFCREKNLQSKINEKIKLHSPRVVRIQNSKNSSDTKTESFELFKKGMTVSEIATQRKLNENTVTDHLIHFILTGDINVLKFISKEKLETVNKAVDEHGDLKLSFLKEKLGDKFTYPEIKAVLNYRNRKK